jgi:hypothetical protein
MSSRIITPAFALVALVLVSGCTAEPAPLPAETEVYASAEATPEDPAVVTPNPVEPDTTLIIRAVATAATGEQLSLEMQVHQGVRWDDVPNQTLPAALIEDCGGTLNAELFASESWSFTRATLTAIPTAETIWPAAQAISVVPDARAVYASGRGVLASDSSNGTPLCEQPKSLSSSGKGGIAIGIPGDAGSFTGWAQHRFGFSVGEGTTLSECSFEITTLGSSLQGGATWAPSSTPTTCSTGPATETAEY